MKSLLFTVFKIFYSYALFSIVDTRTQLQFYSIAGVTPREKKKTYIDYKEINYIGVTKNTKVDFKMKFFAIILKG